MKLIRSYLLLIVAFSLSLSQASECYFYHTPTRYTIKVEENNKATWIETTTDPNGVSTTKNKKIIFQGVNTDDLHLITGSGNYLIIADSDYYYQLSKNASDVTQKGPIKIVETNRVSGFFATRTFLVDNQWAYFDFDAKSQTFKETVISGFPANPELIYHFGGQGMGRYLLKDEDHVYIYDEQSLSIQLIPDLEAKSTQFITTGRFYETHFLYDKDTFYLTNHRFDEFQDITSAFTDAGLEKPLTSGQLISTHDQFLFDFNEGGLWRFENGGFSFIKGLQYHKKTDLFSYQGKYYRYLYSLFFEDSDIDMSQVKNPKALKTLSKNFLTDNLNLYLLIEKHNKSILQPIDIESEAQPILKNLRQEANQAASSYQHQLTPFFTDGQFIWQENRQGDKQGNGIHQTFLPRRPYQQIKDLTLAYLVDEDLLIENKFIPTTLDFATTKFMASTVKVISPCETYGEAEYFPPHVEYSYYFTDKNGMYRYRSGQNKLKKIKPSSQL